MRGTRAAALVAAATLILATLSGLSSCRYGLDELFGRTSPVDARVTDASPPAPAVPPVTDPLSYTFIATGDCHFHENADPPAAAGFRALVAAFAPAFVVIAGDLVDAGLAAEYARYSAWVASLGGVRVYATPGNHDLYNDGWTSFRGVVGRGNYSFVVGGRTFYFVDSGNGTVGRVQLELLREAFARDANPKVVVSHYPLYNGPDAEYYRLTNTAERAALVDLYARGGVELILEGHKHVTRESVLGPMREWLCSSLTGAAGTGSCVVVTVIGGRISSVVPVTY